LDFRACLSPLEINPNDGVVIPQSTVEALQVNIGDTVRYVSPWKEVHE
jgi:arginine/ornithine N-succinyltransferase beta subunit